MLSSEKIITAVCMSALNKCIDTNRNIQAGRISERLFGVSNNKALYGKLNNQIQDLVDSMLVLKEINPEAVREIEVHAKGVM